MKWSRKHTLIAGISLIAAVNAIALGGVAYNRSGEADSQLHLTQRELKTPYVWSIKRSDNSGMALTLDWRVFHPKAEKTPTRYMDRYSNPEWLNTAKMSELGFSLPPETNESTYRSQRQQKREVLLVLEFDGPAYQQTLARVREETSAELALAANNSGKEFEQRAKNAEKHLQEEENSSSRLFFIDLGLDRAALRAKYPDRSHYAIVRGMLEPVVVGKNKERRLSGYIRSLANNEIHVPKALRTNLEEGGVKKAGEVSKPSFTADVAFGQRLEPWLKSASAEKTTAK